MAKPARVLQRSEKAHPYVVRATDVQRAQRQMNAASKQSLVTLFSLGSYDRNQLSIRQLDKLRDWIDSSGAAEVAKALAVSEITLFRVCAGFGHRLRPGTAMKFRKYFNVNVND
jgi:hypothetical protein